MKTSSAIIVQTTTANKDQAKNIATHLIKEKIAACVQIIGPINSVYMWQDIVQDECEYLLIIKSLSKHYEAIERCIQRYHSYDTPEIIAIDIHKGQEHYLKWLDETLATPLSK